MSRSEYQGGQRRVEREVYARIRRVLIPWHIEASPDLIGSLRSPSHVVVASFVSVRKRRLQDNDLGRKVPRRCVVVRIDRSRKSANGTGQQVVSPHKTHPELRKQSTYKRQSNADLTSGFDHRVLGRS